MTENKEILKSCQARAGLGQHTKRSVAGTGSSLVRCRKRNNGGVWSVYFDAES